MRGAVFLCGILAGAAAQSSAISRLPSVRNISLAKCDPMRPGGPIAAGQLWNVSTACAAPGRDCLNLVRSACGSAGCLEVSGCSYTTGAAVGVSSACKGLPKPGSADKCAANMAWKTLAKDKIGEAWPLVLAWEANTIGVTHYCLDIDAGGGSLAACSMKASQKMTLKPIGGSGLAQLVSAVGGCLVAADR